MKRDFENSIFQSLLFLPIFVSISFSNGQPDCAPSPFNCGEIKNISYPFWTAGHSLSCSHPGFELRCEADSTPQIKIGSRKYRVKKIDYEKQVLRVADMEYFIGKKCPQPSINATVDFSIFQYAPDDFHLTLYSSCSLPSTMNLPLLPCLTNESKGIYVYYIIEDGPPHDVAEHFRSCTVSVIPLYESFARRLKDNPSIYGDALKEGFDLKWTADLPKCTDCVRSGGNCGYNSTNPTCTKNNEKGKRKIRKIIIGAFGAAVGIFLVCLFFFLSRVISSITSRQKFWRDNLIFIWKKRTKDAHNVEEFLKNYGSLILQRYRYSEIKKITNSFKDKLGQGGYGGVFKGKLFDGRLVAVKVLNETKGNGEEFINEVASIGRTYHVNIVTLLGFCSEGSKRALIYDFMPNGSLEKFIYAEKPRTTNHTLGWEKLYQIAVGIARGLEYLHRGCSTRILHFDIKPHNILLDQDFCPKISDFGLAKLCPTKDSIISMLSARGTVGYIAPEVFCRNFGGVSYKSDVYSYGMMVLEMVGGRRNIDAGVENTSEIYFPQWIYKRLDLNKDLLLHGIATQVEEETARKMIIVGLWCIQTHPTNRPTISRVVEMLEGSLESLPMPPDPVLSSPTRPESQSSTTCASKMVT